MKTRLPNFRNRVVSVVCENEDTGQLILNPAFQLQGGRVFLVGTVPPDASQDNWMEGLTTAIAWDTVQDYVVFDSMSDFLTRLNSQRPKKPLKPIKSQPPRNRMKK